MMGHPTYPPTPVERNLSGTALGDHQRERQRDEIIILKQKLQAAQEDRWFLRWILFGGGMLVGCILTLGLLAVMAAYEIWRHAQ